jgi:hypothetical protein
MLMNTVFSMLSLLETCFVLFLAFHTDDHLVPAVLVPPYAIVEWFAWLIGMPRPSVILRRDREESSAHDILKHVCAARTRGSSHGGCCCCCCSAVMALCASAQLWGGRAPHRRLFQTETQEERLAKLQESHQEGHGINRFPPSDPPFELLSDLPPTPKRPQQENGNRHASFSTASSLKSYSRLVQLRPLTAADEFR